MHLLKRDSDEAQFDGRSREDPEILHREEMLDEALEETFPASDPISF